MDTKHEPPPRVHRRPSPRAGTWVSCRTPRGPDLAFNLVNVSEGGVCLALSGTLAVGQEVEVELLAPGWRRPVKRPGRVAWAAGRNVGVSFLAALTPSEFRCLCPEE